MAFSIFFTIVFFMALSPFCRLLLNALEVREAHRIYPDSAAFAGLVLLFSPFLFGFSFLDHDDTFFFLKWSS
jgi:Na+-driven multidrug efflux pump